MAEAEAQSAALNARQAELLRHIAELRQERATLLTGQEPPLPAGEQPLVTHQSPQEAKIALFRSLFRGREDVYPKRFVSLKTGKSGYQPACRNP
ncbi:MAG TPA: hypothetical protein VI566_02090, partial [Xanthomonadales bacterium]|nr:hypothetical protein [Xanthomonadales bacterium]